MATYPAESAQTEQLASQIGQVVRSLDGLVVQTAAFVQNLVYPSTVDLLAWLQDAYRPGDSGQQQLLLLLLPSRLKSIALEWGEQYALDSSHLLVIYAVLAVLAFMFLLFVWFVIQSIFKMVWRMVKLTTYALLFVGVYVYLVQPLIQFTAR
ncbi:uncharacterized protein BJ171DRAFT_505855 [Polychytrium aggregatum]|uniref:uncharacterized protein n=1 Tax=Polychytrium aggregatum TaxID=110093 RepID=UPI0022FF45D2|nr:uncharacterized protein BJ171DRAFT_505855 [Polychytrium aggregatum]KAI9204448.1 hypothetical protein BJ171DRAFT_505855 [Polychytrium aggregatum]